MLKGGPVAKRHGGPGNRIGGRVDRAIGPGEEQIWIARDMLRTLADLRKELYSAGAGTRAGLYANAGSPLIGTRELSRSRFQRSLEMGLHRRPMVNQIRELHLILSTVRRANLFGHRNFHLDAACEIRDEETEAGDMF